MPHLKSRLVVACQQALVGAAVLAMAAPAAEVVDLQIVSPTHPAAAAASSQARGAALVASHPVDPRVSEVPLPGGTGAARVAGRPQLAVLSAPVPVSGLATVGVSWDPGQVRGERGIRVRVRSLDHGRWGAWQKVDYDAQEGPTPGSPEAAGARPGTEPMLVGDVDKVQVEVFTPSGRAPRGMRLAVIDPGRTTAPVRQRPSIDTARLAAADTTTASSALVTAKPKIFSRAQWGADESMRQPSSLSYGEVHAAFVHHTVNSNDYTRAQVPAIIRGIYAYHTKSLGWSDIGYNFLVDRFGRIWEGRFGGVDRPVVGAHTYGYNYVSFAMAAIGNFQKARPSRAILRAYGRLFAWKLSLHGVDPADMNVWVKDRYLPAIDGHRDVYPTECPGKYLYRRLPAIRRLAAAHQVPFTSRQKTTNLSGSHWPDLVVRDATTHEVYQVRTGGQVGYQAGAPTPALLAGTDLVAAPGDLNGDHLPDLLARDSATGGLSLYPGNGAGGFDAPTRATTRFAGVDQITGVGDLDLDGSNDVVARDAATQALYLYPGDGKGRYSHRRLLSPDWSAYDLTTGVGDFNGDGLPDLVGRAGGQLWLVPGTGSASIGTPVLLPGSWEGYDLVSGAGDVTNDRRPDIVARVARTGLLYVFPGDGHGGLGHPYGPYLGFRDVDYLAVAGNVTGRRWDDLVGRTGQGDLVVFANDGRRNLTRTVDTHVAFQHANLILKAGDWNGDGRGDVVARSPRGVLWLYAGMAHGRLAPGARMSGGWGQVRMLAAVGDMTGDGYPDLMGQPRGGDMRIYPGDGSTGFLPSYVAHNAIAGNAQVGAGLWNADGSPDSILRSGRKLVLYPGNGPGGLTGGTAIAGGARRYNRLLGPGDVDGDGYPDVVVRQRRDGTLWLLPGAGQGVRRRQYVGSGFDRYDLIG